METRIKTVMADVLGVDKSSITDDSSFEKIEQWDSLNHIKLIVALEEEFDVEFDDEEVGNMMNYQMIKLIVEKKI